MSDLNNILHLSFILSAHVYEGGRELHKFRLTSIAIYGKNISYALNGRAARSEVTHDNNIGHHMFLLTLKLGKPQRIFCSYKCYSQILLVHFLYSIVVLVVQFK